jgi:N5-hydroxyornithine acetyltransferase
MAPSIVHVPNGQTLTVTPVFGGLFFKANDLSNNHSPFPPGWTIVLHTEEDEEQGESKEASNGDDEADTIRPTRRRGIHRYKAPTLQNDHLFISSISSPSSSDFKPASSPTRMIAMMLWATLWWYFHQPEPNPHITNKYSEKTAEAGKPHGDWRVYINREGIFKGKVILPKLERMGLITTEDSTVGPGIDDRFGEGWLNMFVSRRSFWQLDARIYLFTLSPMSQSPYPSGSPYASRPSSPSGQGDAAAKRDPPQEAGSPSQGLWSPNAPGPFHSASHLPTFYPPAPTQYTFTNHVRHPIRPKPPRQGEVFYMRYIPSVGQYLSFRAACLGSKPITYRGPVASPSANAPNRISQISQMSLSDSALPTVQSLNLGSSDTDLLHKWMNDQRVSQFWGEQGPKAHQQAFLERNMKSRHSFPAIGCWDGKPFGYFEIYWVKEDILGKYLGGSCGDYDRGFHCLVGEQEFRGPHRVKIWLSALVHYCWLADNRTDTVMLEPRVDNEK